jgi:uncharacterized membrane protein
MVFATFNDGLYNTILWLHIVCAVVGFGAVALNGLYAQQIRNKLQQGRVAEALAVHDANFSVSKIGEYFIYAVFLLGFGVLGLAKVGDHTVYSFSQTWVWLSVLLYVVGIGLSHGVMIPGAKRLAALMREIVAGPPPADGPPPQATEMATIGQRLGTVGPILDIILVVIIALMVFKPGK